MCMCVCVCVCVCLFVCFVCLLWFGGLWGMLGVVWLFCLLIVVLGALYSTIYDFKNT